MNIPNIKICVWCDKRKVTGLVKCNVLMGKNFDVGKKWQKECYQKL